MKRALFWCDGARVPASVRTEEWDVAEPLSHRGPRAAVNLHIESPARLFRASIGGREADLLRIAAYAYAADQRVPRGGDADVYGDAWSREIVLYLPVSEPAFWSRPELERRLRETLNFLSGDRWSFVFSQAAPDLSQLAFGGTEEEVSGRPDSVYLFSGGLDSLAAVVEAVRGGRRPLLIGHSPAHHIGSRQRELVSQLRDAGLSWAFPYVSAAVHRAGPEPRDFTQRTRSFLYAALGMVAARALGLSTVALADNGVVSLNLPLNDQLVGSTASRTTHPKFLWLFNELVAAAFEGGPRVHNPLWSRTRVECLDILKTAGLQRLVPWTGSCSHHRGRLRQRPHCGGVLSVHRPPVRDACGGPGRS